MPNKKRRKRKPPTPDQVRKKEQRKLTRSILAVFERTGFSYVPSTGIHLDYRGAKSEIDQIHICDGCIVLVEETCHKEADKIRGHLGKKIHFHQAAEQDRNGFLQYLSDTIPGFKAAIRPEIELRNYQLRFVYCTRYPFAKENRAEYAKVIFLRHEYLKHFLHLARTIGKSARFELYKFLGLELAQVRPNDPPQTFEYEGFVLPENRSGFDAQFKVVTFYMDPERLTEIAYSLRRDSWMDAEGLYQRILSRSKIRKMRTYLAKEGHVYVNNIIVGLPNTVRITNAQGQEIPLEDINRVQIIKIYLPARFNSVGLIDGQHRVFSYHEGSDVHEAIIKAKRQKQQLLVTGLLFPEGISETARLKQEAKIFLEINAEQTSAKAELKQAIETIVSPYTSIALAKSVISSLAERGAFMGELHDHYYDDGAIKTSSIIAYGLKYLVGIDPPNSKSSFISQWDRKKAKQLAKRPSGALRKEYVAFCATHLDIITNAFLATVPEPLRSARNKDSRAMSVTMINGLLYCTRRLLQENRLQGDFDAYRAAFQKHGLDLNRGRFKFKSSQWKSLGDLLAKNCFGIDPLPAPPPLGRNPKGV